MQNSDMRTPVRIECLERDYGIQLTDLFCHAERHYFENMSRGVVMPQQQQTQTASQQLEARPPILTKLNFWYKLPSDVGFLVERFMQCRPGIGYGIPDNDPRMVEYVGACEAFTQSLAEVGHPELRAV